MVRHKDRKYQTFCPEHGWGVSIDEDGCCGGCGCVADGSGIDEVAADLTRLRALVEALFNEQGYGYLCKAVQDALEDLAPAALKAMYCSVLGGVGGERVTHPDDVQLQRTLEQLETAEAEITRLRALVERADQLADTMAEQIRRMKRWDKTHEEASGALRSYEQARGKGE